MYCAANRRGDASVSAFLSDRLAATIVPQERSALSSAIGCSTRESDIVDLINKAIIEGHHLFEALDVIVTLAENKVGYWLAQKKVGLNRLTLPSL